jgi:hypothetical protein
MDGQLLLAVQGFKVAGKLSLGCCELIPLLNSWKVFNDVIRALKSNYLNFGRKLRKNYFGMELVGERQDYGTGRVSFFRRRPGKNRNRLQAALFR